MTIKGEILRGAQQEFTPNLYSPLATMFDYQLQQVLPDAVGHPYPLAGGYTSLDKHMMSSVTKGLNRNLTAKLTDADNILGR